MPQEPELSRETSAEVGSDVGLGLRLLKELAAADPGVVAELPYAEIPEPAKYYEWYLGANQIFSWDFDPAARMAMDEAVRAQGYKPEYHDPATRYNNWVGPLVRSVGQDLSWEPKTALSPEQFGQLDEAMRLAERVALSRFHQSDDLAAMPMRPFDIGLPEDRRLIDQIWRGTKRHWPNRPIEGIESPPRQT